MKKSLRNTIAGLGLAGLMGVAGCSADGGQSQAAGGSLSEFDLTGISVSVGSKDFDEQLVLGEVLVAAFESAGATVDNKVDLGGTNIARAALESGDIDIYMEYNGTGWTVHLGQEDPSFDPVELTSLVNERDTAENQIVWLGRSPFNNTYGFTSSPELTEANGGAFTLQTMMEYVRDNPSTVVCMESEFPDRPDGLILTERATGIELPLSQQLILDTGIIYTETAANNCDFGEVFTTDGRIPALNLTLVDDPGVNILYNASGTIRLDKYNEAPEAFEGIIAAILAPLDNIRMAELNGQVSAEGIDPRVVARNFLIAEGLISG